MRTERRPLLLSDTTAKGYSAGFTPSEGCPSRLISGSMLSWIQKIYDLDFFLIRPPVVASVFSVWGLLLVSYGLLLLFSFKLPSVRTAHSKSGWLKEFFFQPLPLLFHRIFQQVVFLYFHIFRYRDTHSLDFKRGKRKSRLSVQPRKPQLCLTASSCGFHQAENHIPASVFRFLHDCQQHIFSGNIQEGGALGKLPFMVGFKKGDRLFIDFPASLTVWLFSQLPS